MSLVLSAHLQSETLQTEQLNSWENWNHKYGTLLLTKQKKEKHTTAGIR